MKKVELEFAMNTSPKLLYNRLSTPSGLSEWFADNVTIKNGKLNFMWEKSEQQAEILYKKQNKIARYKWTDDEDEETYFEFKIVTRELTGDVALVITDFAEDDNDEDDVTELWNTQVAKLKHAIGI